MAGELKLVFSDLDSYDNIGNGMYTRINQGKFKDPQGNDVIATGTLYVEHEGQRFQEQRQRRSP